MIPFSNFLNHVRLHFTKNIDSSPNVKAKVKGNNAKITQIVNSVAEPDSRTLELSRQTQLITSLRNQWLLNNDGITPTRIAGLEWGSGEQSWVNGQLAMRGEQFTA